MRENDIDKIELNFDVKKYCEIVVVNDRGNKNSYQKIKFDNTNFLRDHHSLQNLVLELIFGMRKKEHTKENGK